MKKYKYFVKIHKALDFKELESKMNEYGENGIRVTKVEKLNETQYIFYLEEKIK